MKTRLVLVAGIALATSACVEVRPEYRTDGVSGAYVGLSSGHRLASATPIRHSLQINVAESGLVSGLWVTRGDTLMPKNPWKAPVTGVFEGPGMVLEYLNPRVGSCHLDGYIDEFRRYRTERRCADDWDEADTLKLDFFPMWRGLVVRDEAPDDPEVPYQDFSFGRPGSKEEQAIIKTLPQRGDTVFTPYSCLPKKKDGSETDIEHMVAKKEAYMSGLTKSQATGFGKDMANLTIADPAVNSDKGSHDTWQPRFNRGWFAERLVRAKQKYALSVDEMERYVLAKMLRDDPSRSVACP